MTDSARLASQWADAKSAPVSNAASFYLANFGDGPVRVFQSPARVNLRGMHVDTHGGYLNLMAIPRYTVVVLGETATDECTVVSALDVDSPYCRELSNGPKRSEGWRAYIDGVINEVAEMQGATPRGFNACIVSDIPMGGGLSSSSALCTAFMKALIANWGAKASLEEQAVAIQAAEWHAGARIGLSDQSAMLIAQRDGFTNIAINPNAPSLDGTPIPWSDEVSLVVAHSGTSRSLSGAQRVDYARNRFAYSAAMPLVRAAMHRLEYSREFLDDTRLLSDLTTRKFEAHGGDAAIVKIINAIQARGSLEDIVSTAGDEVLEAYDAYFGDLPEEQRPREFALRGPLLYGIAESERARVFGDCFVSKDWKRVGAILCAGHDGDRVVASDGLAHHRSADASAPLVMCPGDYGASTPILDYLVDTAMTAGAYGATLTGAGMGGAIIALFPASKVEEGVAMLRAAADSSEFHERIDANTEVGSAEIFSVTPVDGAGELAYNPTL